MAVLVKVSTAAKMLKAGDLVQSQGLVIAVERRFEKVKVTFKGSLERVFPNEQTVIVLVTTAPPEAPTIGLI